MSGDKASKKKIGPGGKKSVVLTKRNYGAEEGEMPGTELNSSRARKNN